MTTLQLFGSAEQCAAATAMIEEAIDNKEQKVKQRQKEYDKKKEVSEGLQQECVCLCRVWSVAGAWWRAAGDVVWGGGGTQVVCGGRWQRVRRRREGACHVKEWAAKWEKDRMW